MKEYQKPELDIVEFNTLEDIAEGTENPGASFGTGDLENGWT